MQRATNLAELPPEILLIIFSLLTPENVISIASTIKSFRQITADDLFWREKIKRHFPKIENLPKNNLFQEFVNIYQHQYKNMSLVARQIISLINERQHKEILVNKKLDFSFLSPTVNILDEKDADGISVMQRLQQVSQSQVIWNFLYSRAENEYTADTSSNLMTKTDSKGRTLLHWAILCYQSDETLKKLLAYGFNPCVLLMQDKVQAIHLAAQIGNLNALRILLAYDPNLLNIRNKYNQTPIMLAALHGHTAVVRALKARAGIDLTVQTNTVMNASDDESLRGLNALHLAAYNNQVDAFNTLIAGVPNIPIQSPAGNGRLSEPLHIACVRGSIDVVKEILTQQPDLINHATAIIHGTPLYIAVLNRQVKLAEYLMAQNADVTQSGLTTYRTLDAACQKGLLGIVKQILTAHPDFLDQVYPQETASAALVAALEGKQSDVVEYLISQGINCLGTVLGQNVLHIACKGGDLKSIHLLLDAHLALLNQVNLDGRTPIFLAAENNHSDVVEELIRRGADLTVRDNIQRTVLHYTKNADCAKRILDEKPELLNSVDNVNMTPIMNAADRANSAMVEFLASRSADLSPQCSYAGRAGWTVLHFVSYHCNKPALKSLLDRSPNLELKDAYGLTALQMSTRSSSSTSITRALIKAGANTHDVTDSGETLVDLAVSKDAVRLIMYTHEFKEKKRVYGIVTEHDKFKEKHSIPAAKALQKVLFDGADAEILDPYKETLRETFPNLLPMDTKRKLR